MIPGVRQLRMQFGRRKLTLNQDLAPAAARLAVTGNLIYRFFALVDLPVWN